MSDPRRFIGRKATGCRKCNGIDFYVNRMGGVVCQTCSPPRSAEDNCQVLTIEGGVWIDPLDRFDMVTAETVSQCQLKNEVKNDKKNEVKNEVTNIPLNLQRSRSTRGPDGELSEVELELFDNPDLWGTPNDLIVAHGKHIIWVAKMFSAFENPDRQAVPGPAPIDVKPQKREALAAVLFT